MTRVAGDALSLALCAAAGAGLWGWTQAAHRRLARRVPLRVLVGGSRGKTTAARLITAALRARGQRVCARTTGRHPEETLDGAPLAAPIDWRPFPRLGEPSVDEISRWLAAVARRLAPDAAVMENPGVAPEAIWAVGRHLFPPTLVVITDAVPDHLDTWPLDPVDIARLHLRAVPRGVPVLTTDETVAASARALGHRVSQVPHLDAPSLPPWMASLASLAVAVAQGLGTPVADLTASVVAAAGRLLPQPLPLDSGGLFLDLFDANDPLSAQRALVSIAPGPVHAALFAHRRDRAWRWAAFRPWIERAFPRVVRFDAWPDATVSSLLAAAPAGQWLIGLGNANGPAQAFLASLRGARG